MVVVVGKVAAFGCVADRGYTPLVDTTVVGISLGSVSFDSPQIAPAFLVRKSLWVAEPELVVVELVEYLVDFYTTP